MKPENSTEATTTAAASNKSSYSSATKITECIYTRASTAGISTKAPECKNRESSASTTKPGNPTHSSNSASTQRKKIRNLTPSQHHVEAFKLPEKQALYTSELQLNNRPQQHQLPPNKLSGRSQLLHNSSLTLLLRKPPLNIILPLTSQLILWRICSSVCKWFPGLILFLSYPN